MEKCAEAQATDTHSGGSSSQVVFINIPDSYPPAAPVTCCYTVNAFQPSNKDWVGLFKVRKQGGCPFREPGFIKILKVKLPLQKGWRKTRDYYTFVWVDPCQDVKEHLSEIRQAVFNGNKFLLSHRLMLSALLHTTCLECLKCGGTNMKIL